MSRGPDAGTLLERRLRADALAAGVALSIDAADWRRWASATFTGARHRLTATAMPRAAGGAWLEAELTLRGHLVADLVVAERRRDGDALRVVLEVLTVEEA